MNQNTRTYKIDKITIHKKEIAFRYRQARYVKLNLAEVSSVRAFNLKSDSLFGPIHLPLLYATRLICGFHGDATSLRVHTVGRDAHARNEMIKRENKPFDVEINKAEFVKKKGRDRERERE